MRDDFECYGQGAFQMAPEHSQQNAVFHTDQMLAEASPRDSLERQAWKSKWQEAGWLHDNPLVRFAMTAVYSHMLIAPYIMTNGKVACSSVSFLHAGIYGLSNRVSHACCLHCIHASTFEPITQSKV